MMELELGQSYWSLQLRTQAVFLILMWFSDGGLTWAQEEPAY